MSFDDLFRKDRPIKMLQRTPSCLAGGPTFRVLCERVGLGGGQMITS
jgi:hypothetical protein